MRRLLVVAAFLVAPSAATAATPVISSSAVSGAAPLTIRFDGSANEAVNTWSWSFGDGSTAEGPVVSHRYAKPGRYEATLTVRDQLGGASSSSVIIRAQALTVALSRPRVVFGTPATFRGSVVPAEATRVLLERRDGSTWKLVKAAQTSAAGRFAVRVLPGRTGVWRSRIAGSDVRSQGLKLDVAPRLTVRARAGIAFVGATVVVRAQPPIVARAHVTVLRSALAVAETTIPVGRPVLVPAPGIGRFTLRVEAGGSSATAPLEAGARALAIGSTGADVVALRARLAELHVHVPGPSTQFGYELYDAVIAFQKSRGLARTGQVTDDVWRALTAEVLPKPRYRGPGEHIEIDKTRQILLVVDGGATDAFLPVSSGATGNTPEGAWHILWKAPATSTWLGSAILYRTMTFHTNFAIHGYPSVPAYPASHGCVRIPIWTADWLYQRSPAGEPVYVYA